MEMSTGVSLLRTAQSLLTGRTITACNFVQSKCPYISHHAFRVGSHVVSVKIHCTEKWRTSFHTDVFKQK